MNRITISARDRRALGLGVRVLAPLLLLFGVVRPMVAGIAAERDALAREHTLLTREANALRRGPGWAAAAIALDRRRDSLDLRAFAGPDAITTAAALARFVLEAAEEEGLRLEIAESRAADDSSGWMRLAVDARGTGDLAALLALLSHLEGTEHLAGVERLTIEQRDASLLDDDDAPLAFTMSVRSLGRIARTQAGPAGGGP